MKLQRGVGTIIVVIVFIDIAIRYSFTQFAHSAVLCGLLGKILTIKRGGRIAKGFLSSIRGATVCQQILMTR